jgi:hypothetical protein
LVRWSNLPDTDATWEDYLQIRQQFPTFAVEDNTNLEREGMSAMLNEKGSEELGELVLNKEEKKQREKEEEYGRQLRNVAV